MTSEQKTAGSLPLGARTDSDEEEPVSRNAILNCGRRLLCTFLIAAVGATVVATSSAAGTSTVVPPTGTLYGAPYSEWLSRWTRWAFTQPAPSNPLAKPTDCTIAPQPGEHMWLLTASSGGRQAVACTIPRGRALFVPVAEILGYAETPQDTFATLRSSARAVFTETSVLRASIDGRPVQGLRAYKAASRNLLLDLPKENIFGAPAGPTRMVIAGYNLLVQGLTPGKHTIITYVEMKATADEPVFKAGMTYRITID